jgi:hypothetical protein
MTSLSPPKRFQFMEILHVTSTLEGDRSRIVKSIQRYFITFSGMHSNLVSFKKPKIQFSQCQDAQTPNKPVSKQPKFIMPTLPSKQPVSKTPVLLYRDLYKIL